MASRIYNAWVPAIDTVFDPVLHARTELIATSYKLDHEEGGVARLTITCKNPGIGILAPGRDPYMLVSWADEGETPRLIFRGVANSMPANLAEALITLEFLAQPDDFEELLLAFARTLATRPYVDDLISGLPQEITDPAVVLEARSEVFHIDPVTHEITLSDIINYDRLVDLGPHYVRDTMVPSLGQPPVRKCTMNFVAEWTQRAEGEVDIASRVNFGGGELGRLTLTDVSSIGQKGEIDQSGWSVGDVEQEEKEPTLTQTKYFNGNYQIVLHQIRQGFDGTGQPYWKSYVRTRYGVQPLALYRYKATSFPMRYSYSQPRREIQAITASADVQDVNAFGWKEEELDDIGLNSLTEDTSTPQWEEEKEYHVGDRVLRGNRAWLCQQDHTSTDQFQTVLDDYARYDESRIKPFMKRWVQTTKNVALKNKSAATFFGTDRGRQIAEHGLLRVRAFLRHRLRALTVTFRGRWEDLHDISLRDGCRIEHYFFDAAGGWVRGKVISYSKVWSGDTGERYVEVTIGVSVANGNVDTLPEGGTAYSEAFETGYSWADDDGVGYTVGDMQYTVGGEKVSTPVKVEWLKYPGYACVAVNWTNTIGDQLRAAARTQLVYGNALEAVAAIPTTYNIRMRSLSNTDIIERKVKITGTTVTARKDIDLAFGG
ncbi:hypothetical protein [Shinella zoogloeoides]|uniref:hypothetical protein n=1 Tax=Shinella zoogloeoides TaxID=352475 RepID=UPI0028B19226|nr:hypothetical protein [Shinella zoogloeoides]